MNFKFGFTFKDVITRQIIVCMSLKFDFAEKKNKQTHKQQNNEMMLQKDGLIDGKV